MISIITLMSAPFQNEMNEICKTAALINNYVCIISMLL